MSATSRRLPTTVSVAFLDNETPTPITVLGVGNPIMADDGVGLALMAALQQRTTDPRVRFIDGGTGGMELVPIVQESRRLLLLDAVAGATPGQVVHLVGDQIPRMLAAILSPHQVSLLDVLAAARLLGTEPEVIDVVGITPESVDLRWGLSPQVEQAIDAAVNLAYDIVRQWLDQIDSLGTPDVGRESDS